MLKTERRFGVIRRANNPLVNDIIRADRVDRIIQMHNSYGHGCKDETLYLTVYLMDKYLEMCTLTDIRQLDLLAITAFYIAGKYEDIYPPKLDQILAWANF